MAEAAEPQFPKGVSAPAARALTAAGYTELAQLADVPAADLAQLHGMGPKALVGATKEPRQSAPRTSSAALRATSFYGWRKKPLCRRDSR